MPYCTDGPIQVVARADGRHRARVVLLAGQRHRRVAGQELLQRRISTETKNSVGTRTAIRRAT
jgi:hypothetical protein